MIALREVQGLPFGLAERHEVCVDLLLEPVKVHRDHQCINCTSQLSVICRPAAGTLDPTVAWVKPLNSICPGVEP